MFFRRIGPLVRGILQEVIWVWRIGRREFQLEGLGALNIEGPKVLGFGRPE